MNFSRNLIILSSCVIMTAACSSKKDQNNPQQPSPALSAQSAEASMQPTAALVPTSDVEPVSLRLEVRIPFLPGQAVVYSHELTESREYVLSQEGGAEHKMTALVYGSDLQFIVAVREVPTDDGRTVSTTFTFVREVNKATYVLYKKEDNKTLVQAQESAVTDFASEEAVVALQKKALVEVTQPAAAATPVASPAPQDVKQEPVVDQSEVKQDEQK